MFDWFPCNAVVVSVFWFLRIISEGAGKRGLVCLGLTMETLTLYWHVSDTFLIYTSLTLDIFFHVFLLKVIIVFINIVYALSLSEVAIIESLLLTLSRWQWFPRRKEYFFLIQSTIRQQPLLWLLVTSKQWLLVTSNEPLAQVVVK